jgi:hypothetical protein
MESGSKVKLNGLLVSQHIKSSVYFCASHATIKVRKSKGALPSQSCSQEKSMEITLDTTLGELLADQKTKAILDKHLPGISSNPMISMAKGMSLKMILAMPQAAQLGLTKEKVDALLKEINKVV